MTKMMMNVKIGNVNIPSLYQLREWAERRKNGFDLFVNCVNDVNDVNGAKVQKFKSSKVQTCKLAERAV